MLDPFWQQPLELPKNPYCISSHLRENATDIHALLISIYIKEEDREASDPIEDPKAGPGTAFFYQSRGSGNSQDETIEVRMDNIESTCEDFYRRILEALETTDAEALKRIVLE